MTTTTPPTADHPRTAASARTAVRLDHTRELLAILPHQLGFQPRDSVVLVALRPPGRTVGLVARVDLADLLRHDGPELVAGAVAHLVADDAHEVVVVVYDDGDDPRDPGRGLRARPGSDVVRAAEVARSAAERVGPVTVWCLVRDHYLGLDCRDGGCCPPGGRPVADLAAGDLAGRLLGRAAVAADRGEVGLIRPAPPGPRRAAAAARSRWLDRLLRADDSARVLRWRQRSLDAWRAALAAACADPGASVGAAVLGRVEAGLLDPVVRDAVVLTLVGTDDDLPDALLRTAPDVFGRGRRPGGGPAEEVDEAGDDDGAGVGSGGADGGGADGRDGEPGTSVAAPAGRDRPEEVRAVSARIRDCLDRVVDPERGREPDDALAAAACRVLERVVAHGRRDRQAPALTVLALLAWWGGDGVLASVLVERALDQDPGHRLAELLDRALGAGLPPGWVRRRC